VAPGALAAGAETGLKPGFNTLAREGEEGLEGRFNPKSVVSFVEELTKQ